MRRLIERVRNWTFRVLCRSCDWLMTAARVADPAAYQVGCREACREAAKVHYLSMQAEQAQHAAVKHTTACIVPGCRQCVSRGIGVAPLCDLHWQCIPTSHRLHHPEGGLAWFERHMQDCGDLVNLASKAGLN